MCKNLPPLEQAIQFHGHICPGLLIGVRAAEFAQQHLGVGVDEDEQLIAIVENDNCSVDAIQAILSCTFGKGNLVFRDYGKNVWTIGSRQSGKAVRIAQKFNALQGIEYKRFGELATRVLNEDEAAEKEMLIGVLFEKVMSMPVEELFAWQDLQLDFPPRARIVSTLQCASCGEGVMETRATKTGRGMLCPDCIQKEGDAPGV